MELRTFRSLQVPWSAVPLINLGQSDLATGGGYAGGCVRSEGTQYTVYEGKNLIDSLCLHFYRS